MIIDFTQIPNTHFLTLTNDTNLTPKALLTESIIIEHELADLPEVKELKKGDMVVDVGAYIGDTAIIFAKSGASVMAFEPQLDAYLCGINNTKHYINIGFFNYAVGDGQRVIVNDNPIDGNLGTRTVSLSEEGVSTVCLDKIPFAKLDFLKIDVEGFEPAVIKGALEVIKKFKPKILVEVYPELLERNGYSRNDISVPLEALGYVSKVAIGDESESRYDLLFR